MDVLGEMITVLPEVYEQHKPGSALYRMLDRVARQEAERLFSEEEASFQGPFGEILFPYFKMGAIDSKDLFGLDELIIFSFYWQNRNRYKRALDIGANIGLHSTVLAKSGYEVRLFEPDPIHVQKLQEVLRKNGVTSASVHQAAVSCRSGEAEFVRVLGNTTSSHLAGAKQPYGSLERFQVPLFDIKTILQGADLVKMDVEGHEADILCHTDREDWRATDAMLEVGTEENARRIFAHMNAIGLNGFSQKTGWHRVERPEDMPTSYREGSLFLTRKEVMPWAMA
jgi:FkbM family methyltransferase